MLGWISSNEDDRAQEDHVNEDRGWSPDPSVVLRHRVVCWLGAFHRSDPTTLPSNSDVAEALGVLVPDVVDSTEALAAEGLANPPEGMVASANSAWLTAAGRRLASGWDANRRSVRRRRSACRDAMLDWLYEVPQRPTDARGLLVDTRGWFFGQQFTDANVGEAVTHLHGIGLVEASTIAEGPPVQPFLSEEGKECVERYDSSVAAYLDRKRGGGTNISVTGSQGVNVAADSAGAQQSVTITSNTRQQLVQIADALDATRPVLGLSTEDDERAQAIVLRLRDEAERDEGDPSKMQRLLQDVRTIAVSGSGSAAGMGIIALAQQVAHALGLG